MEMIGKREGFSTFLVLLVQNFIILSSKCPLGVYFAMKLFSGNTEFSPYNQWLNPVVIDNRTEQS